MCLSVFNKEPKIAEKDITVWTNGDVWIGPYMFDLTEFLFDNVIKPKGSAFDDINICKDVFGKTYYEINGGHFHSCETEEECKNLLPYVMSYINRAKKGIFGARYGVLAMRYNLLKICKCTIPAGTELYTDGLYFASKQIIVHKPE